MRRAKVFVNNIAAGVLEETSQSTFRFTYGDEYKLAPVSLTMPLNKSVYEYEKFPPYFEGLLPEGIMLEALLRKFKLDKNDYFGQLLKVGNDMVGAVTIEEIL